ncbi:hypothetical protein [Pseudactinotalea sp. Z1748]|uniref:hypothetical protein n=1 Tax=Pseudactinotalea sp. Z1748 TaxID=3413027 RepID=UPI003C7ACFA7
MSAPHVDHKSQARADRAAELYRTWAREAADGLASLAPALEALPTRVSPQIARAAQATENAWRDIEIEFGMLTSTEVAQRLGYGPNRTWASNQRKAGRLVGVRRGGRYLYPGFQIAQGRVVPAMAGLLELAEEHTWSSESLVLWLCSPSGRFAEGQRPVDVLHGDAEAVLVAAGEAMAPPW